MPEAIHRIPLRILGARHNLYAQPTGHRLRTGYDRQPRGLDFRNFSNLVISTTFSITYPRASWKCFRSRMKLSRSRWYTTGSFLSISAIMQRRCQRSSGYTRAQAACTHLKFGNSRSRTNTTKSRIRYQTRKPNNVKSTPTAKIVKPVISSVVHRQPQTLHTFWAIFFIFFTKSFSNQHEFDEIRSTDRT